MALMPVFENHKEAVSSLQGLISRLGGSPAENSGAWGAWAKIVLGGADLLGKETVLKALQEGEKNGAEDYEEALKITELPSDIRSLIETKLIEPKKLKCCHCRSTVSCTGQSSFASSRKRESGTKSICR